MTVKELKEKSVSELQKLLQESREELGKLSFKVSGNQHSKVRQLRQLKRDIARILTVINFNRHEN